MESPVEKQDCEKVEKNRIGKGGGDEKEFESMTGGVRGGGRELERNEGKK